MSKEFFRYLRGEINGFYLTSLHNVLNVNDFYIKDFLSNMRNLVFKSRYTPIGKEDALQPGEIPMTLEQMIGIGKFAGIYLPYVKQDSDTNAIRFPDPASEYRRAVGEGKYEWDYQDRALFDVPNEVFKFQRTNDNVYTTDINTLATKELMTSLVEDDAHNIGYIKEGTKVFDEFGNIIPGAILDTPPTDGAYSIWYGEKYLTFGEFLRITSQITEKAYYELIKLVQIIRYNGVSIETLAEMGRIFCVDENGKPYVHIVSIDWTKQYAYGILTYRVDYDAVAPKKLMYTNLLLATARIMFPQLAYVEDTATKTNEEAK